MLMTKTFINNLMECYTKVQSKMV